MIRPRVAIVDDEARILRSWRSLLGQRYEVSIYEDSATARQQLSLAGASEVVLLDVLMPGYNGMDLLEVIRDQLEPPEVIILTGFATVERAVEAMRRGAFDFVSKPVEDHEAFFRKIDSAVEQKRLRALNRRLTARLQAHAPNTDLVGTSSAIEQVRQMVARLAVSTTTVLIQGESGTGKELVARALHQNGPRAKGPFVPVNCGAISEGLIESELFGHERGAFTGATSAHVGLFEAAEGGTLFLDEIGEVPPAAQVRLLRAIQEKEVRRVGATGSRSVDVRILAATNVDLEEAVKLGRFREDLFYRLTTFRLSLPPLRERKSDIPLLAQHILDGYARRQDRPEVRMSAQFLAALEQAPWPGNIRQLAGALEHAMTLAEGSELELAHLPTQVLATLATPGRFGVNSTTLRPGLVELPPYRVARSEMLREFEQSYLKQLLESAGSNISEAARRSGLDRANLRRLLRRYNLVSG